MPTRTACHDLPTSSYSFEACRSRIRADVKQSQWEVAALSVGGAVDATWLKHVAFLVAPGIPQRYPRIKELLYFCKYKETGFEICVNHVGFQPFAFLQKSADLVVNWNREQSLLWWPVYSTAWSFSGHPFAWPDLYSRCFRTCGHHGPPLVWGHLSDKWKLSMFPWRQNTRVKI